MTDPNDPTRNDPPESEPDQEAPTAPTEPPPPPASPPPPPGGSGSGSGGGGGGGGAGGLSPGQQNNLMIVLAYLYILALIPLLTEQDDEEVQWHAKHGLVLLGADIALAIVMTILSLGTGGLGCLLAPFQFLGHLALLVVRVICIVQGTKGQRFKLPWLSDLADRF